MKFALAWVKRDFDEWPLRFIAEIIAWALSISCSLIMAITVPNPPLAILYPMWICGCIMYAWAAWTRGSSGMLLNYLLLATIDSIGFIRL
jgi:hypothetical protein